MSKWKLKLHYMDQDNYQSTITDLLSCTELGKTPYKKFIDEQFSRKSRKLIDVICKIEAKRKQGSQPNPLVIQKQNLKALIVLI